MNLLIFFSVSVLDLDKLLTYEFYHDYIILKWSKKRPLFMPLIKTEEFYKDICPRS